MRGKLCVAERSPASARANGGTVNIAESPGQIPGISRPQPQEFHGVPAEHGRIAGELVRL